MKKLDNPMHANVIRVVDHEFSGISFHSVCLISVHPAIVIRQRKAWRRKSGMYIHFEGILLWDIRGGVHKLYSFGRERRNDHRRVI